MPAPPCHRETVDDDDHDACDRGNHALLAGDAPGAERLVPVRHLANDGSVARCAAQRLEEYFHVELDRHDVLFAEGLAAAAE